MISGYLQIDDGLRLGWPDGREARVLFSFTRNSLVIDRALPLLFALLCLAGFAVTAGRADEPAKSAPAPALNFQVKDIDGKSVDLAKTFQGKVLLVVNTASKCGYTKQYAGLETMYDKYKDKGLEVLAFPANEFLAQEPGSDEEIKSFCETKFHVTFPLFSKIVVKGKGIHPFYEYLTDKKTDPKFAGDITWNFNKFLINRKGEVIARFKSDDAPESAKVVKAIEEALAETK
jgi:glutathione peroxidase